MLANLLGLKAERGLTNEDLAQLIGVSRQTFARKLREADFTVREAEILSDYFNKPTDYLFGKDQLLPSEVSKPPDND